MTPDSSFYTILDHTADMGIRVTGPTIAALFRHAALALMEIMLDRRPPGEGSSVRLVMSGEDLPDLLVRWLGEILYLLEGEGKVVMDMDIHDVGSTRIDATLQTVPFDAHLHEITTEVKAVTYHQAHVGPCEEGWEATVVFDL